MAIRRDGRAYALVPEREGVQADGVPGMGCPSRRGGASLADGTDRGCGLINVFIGYDSREAVAYSVLAHSICSRASSPVSVSPLMLSNLQQLLTRERHPLQSTDFAFSRFLVPLLSGYSGWSV